MLEIYSKNQTIAATTGIIPFTSTALKKGCTSELFGTDTVYLNKCGVYEIIFEGEYVAGTAGNINIQMTKNGTVQQQSIRTVIGATPTESKSVNICTLVQVKDDNTCRCCDSPTVIQFVNTGVEIVGDSNLTITKLC